MTDYTDEQFAEDYLQEAGKPFKDPKLLSQRIPKKELFRRIAHKCRYPAHEVEDMFTAMMQVCTEELERGREVFFDPLFAVRLYKPHARRLYDWKKDDFKTSSARPRLTLRPSDEYLTYTRYGIHSPVNYLPPTRATDPLMNRTQYTEAIQKATQLWKEEEDRRKAKKDLTVQ